MDMNINFTHSSHLGAEGSCHVIGMSKFAFGYPSPELRPAEVVDVHRLAEW